MLSDVKENILTMNENIEKSQQDKINQLKK